MSQVDVSTKDYDGTGPEYTWKIEAVFRRNLTVWEPLTSDSFQVSERKRKKQIFRRMTMGTTSYPNESVGK
jgi:hypothetical protein